MNDDQIPTFDLFEGSLEAYTEACRDKSPSVANQQQWDAMEAVTERSPDPEPERGGPDKTDLGSLALKYRPRRFQDVIGQAGPVAYLVERTKSKGVPSQGILLTGPAGTGKTTLARIYAQAMNCHERMVRNDGTFCGRCEPCTAIQRGNAIFYREWDAGHFPTVSNPVQWINELRCNPPDGPVKVVFIDEAQLLEKQMAGALLKTMEEPPFGLTFVIATTNPEALSDAMRSRCTSLETQLLTEADAYQWLEEICRRERITFEPDGLRMLIARSRGAPRAMVSTLGQVALVSDRHVTPQSFAKAVGLSWVDRLQRYMLAVGRSQLDEQLSALDTWPAPPKEKANAIRNFVSYLYNYEVATPRSDKLVDPAFYLISSSERRQIMQAFQVTARSAGMSIHALWAEMMQFWLKTVPQNIDDAGLDLALRLFHAVVTPEGARQSTPDADVEPQAPPARLAKLKRRPIKGASGRVITGLGRGEYLGTVDLRELVNATSLMTQEYGVLLNTSIDIRLKGDVQALAHRPKAVSAMLHELRQCLNAWSGPNSFHWLYVHNGPEHGTASSRIVAHIPVSALPQSEQWTKQSFARIAANYGLEDARSVFAARLRQSTIAKVNAHWDLFRELVRGLDPQIETSDREPMLDVLDVPKSIRGPSGIVDARRRRSVSNTIGETLQARLVDERMAPISAFDDGQWKQLFTGWELNEFSHRDHERRLRAAQVANLEAEFASAEPYKIRARKVALEDLVKSWPENPKDRRRFWTPWWRREG